MVFEVKNISLIFKPDEILLGIMWFSKFVKYEQTCDNLKIYAKFF